ncbi:LYR family protein [Schizosaccharomyces japonicus yFS275]|uniref:LYR family protein n=1 Tax=Schizosaccharomyces japonicus (strain yFS275 / FY16936) TaxID=402676 RepID=T0S2X7_SCHJY|nr:LYR family protein [Schizosaccharomyces japonicus yFS275]EQC52966.1 LYR family protein [Schizosaccharomyces japonicus yFS275]
MNIVPSNTLLTTEEASFVAIRVSLNEISMQLNIYYASENANMKLILVQK